MRKINMKVIAGAFVAFLIVLAFLLYAPLSQQELYNIDNNNSSDGLTRSADNEDIYKISFAIPHSSAGSAWQYIPIYRQNSEQTAAGYAALFSMPPNSMCEDEDAFYFNDNGGATLTVYKNASMLFYSSGLAASGEASTLNDVAAVSIATEFITRHGLNKSYKEIIVRRSDDAITISFTNRLGGYSNHAFANKVSLDNSGNILSAEYYFYSYDRLLEVKLISVREAVQRLPSDYDEGTRIDLSKYSLTYIYEDSILQPAYLFEGQMSDGTQFRQYVNASDYN